MVRPAIRAQIAAGLEQAMQERGAIELRSLRLGDDTLFLDSALNVRRYTDRITRIIHLREGDIGRPLTDLASTLIYPQLAADAPETLQTLTFSEKPIATIDGLWFLVRIKPYRTLANVIQGVVITLIDITAAKELESRLRKA